MGVRIWAGVWSSPRREDDVARAAARWALFRRLPSPVRAGSPVLLLLVHFQLPLKEKVRRVAIQNGGAAEMAARAAGGGGTAILLPVLLGLFPLRLRRRRVTDDG